MPRTSHILIVLTTFALITHALNTDAHDLVPIPDGETGLMLELGHPGEYRSPELDRLIELNVWMKGSEKPLSVLSGVNKSPNDHAVIDLRAFTMGRAIAIVSGQYDNGYWVTLPHDQHLNTNKLNMPNVIDSGAFFKFGKALFPAASGTGGYDRKLGERLEIVAVNDPFKVRPGQRLSIQVLYMSHPLPDVGVEVSDGKTKIKEEDIPRYKTDRRGVAQIPISKLGLQIVAVDYRTLPRTPQLSDHDDYSASLVFIVHDELRDK